MQIIFLLEINLCGFRKSMLRLNEFALFCKFVRPVLLDINDFDLANSSRFSINRIHLYLKLD